MESLPQRSRVTLRKNEDRRVVSGHPWVFSNEIREISGNPGAGDVVEVANAGGKSIGTGFFNPHSLIAVRLLSTAAESIDEEFLRRRISSAIELRNMLYPHATALRLVHGEADFLPGLVIDRFNDIFCIQTLSYGMDLRLDMVCNALESLVHAAGIVERNESALRLLEGLPQKKGVLRGSAETTVIQEHGLQYTVDVLNGQKTGFFLDQRENRRLAGPLGAERDVLDCFCNDGGFSLNAAQSGARSVLGIDSSGEAVERAAANARLNGITVCSFEQADVFERLKTLRQEERMFDMIVLDPPSFTRSRKSVPAARKGYRELHSEALKLLRRGGVLLTASCSHHITPETFLGDIERASRRWCCRQDSRAARGRRR
jgi:23S rRNA (cytosine1962-C5)-methyltransferase